MTFWDFCLIYQQSGLLYSDITTANRMFFFQCFSLLQQVLIAGLVTVCLFFFFFFFFGRTYTYESPSTYQQSYTKAPPREKAPVPAKSSRLVPVWVQLLVFLVVVVFLYMVFSNMESNEPFRLEWRFLKALLGVWLLSCSILNAF